jgi:hypothetical protein
MVPVTIAADAPVEALKVAINTAESARDLIFISAPR